MIKVCDSIMGSGKTSAAINYINSHLDMRFIYITPYLSEAERITNACPEANFIEPSSGFSKNGFGKLKHTEQLIAQGANIATTHTCFSFYTREMLQSIKEKGYTLLLDEVLSMFEKAPFVAKDLELLVNVGILERKGDTYVVTEEGYHYDGTLFTKFLSYASCRDIFKVKEESDMLFYWTLPIRYLTSFEDVIVMTYMFSGQSMSMYLDINNVDYKYIGVERDADGEYWFTEEMQDEPFISDAEANVRDLISIVDDKKLNGNFFGDKRQRTVGSMSWFNTHEDGVSQLKNNLYNYFKNRCKDVDKSEFMWGTYNCDKKKVKGDGYTKGFVPFNSRATNEFRNRTHLAYAANPFMNVGEKMFLQRNGANPDEDAYALSVLLQWIWRSAIRDGKPVELYLPIPRMRELLNDWLDNVERQSASEDGGDSE